MLNLKVFALDDGDGEARDGLVEADGEEDLGPLGRLRRLDVALEVGMEVELARGEVEVLHAEEGLADDAVLPVYVDVVHEQPEGPRVDRQRGRLKNGYLLCSALSLPVKHYLSRKEACFHCRSSRSSRFVGKAV